MMKTTVRRTFGIDIDGVLPAAAATPDALAITHTARPWSS